LNKNSRAILLGMLLGDGCLKRKHHTQLDGTPSVYYEYVVCHSIKQEEYCQYKLNLFHSIMGGKKPKMHYEKPKVKGVEYESCRFSRCHKSFRILHKYLYSNDNKKYFTDRILNYLTPQAIALRYMDDGGCKKTKRPDGSVSSVILGLYTYCTETEVDKIIHYFEKTWGITAKKSFYAKNKSWNIMFNTKEAKKFESLINEYVIPSMRYKLPSYYNPRVPDSVEYDTDDIVSSTGNLVGVE